MSTATASGLVQVSPRVEERLRNGEITPQQFHDYQEFLAEVDRELMHHRVITDNHYTRWFRKGEATDAELRHFIQQFSVFSNWFLKAALLRVLNASNLDHHRAAREILLNELGVIYRKQGTPIAGHGDLSDDDKDRQGDPELVGTEGTVDGGICRFRANHFEWMLGVGESIGLGFDDMGKRRLGRPSTLYFVDELARLYGSDDPQIAEGASFAVETWAAAGFWQELEDGLSILKKKRYPKLRLAFFSWHNRVEAQHADHSLEELEELYFDPGFDRAKFFEGGKQVLDAIACFWDGLEEDRLKKITSVDGK